MQLHQKMKKIKNRLTVLIFFGFLGCSTTSKMDTTEKVIFSYVDLSLMTPIRVECEKLSEYFKTSVKTKDDVDVEEIDKLKLLLSKLEEIDENYNPKPDTRITIDIIEKDSVEPVCIGYLVVKYRGKSYKNTDQLREHLEKMLF